MREVEDHNLSVCLISRRYPPQYTGAGRQAHTLAKYLIRQVPVLVVSESFDADAGVNIIDGVPVHRLKSFLNLNQFGLNKIVFALKLLIFLIQRRECYNTIHCIGSSFILIPALMTAKLFNKRFIVKITLSGLKGDTPDILRKRAIGKFVYHALLNADAIICISDQIYQICINCNLSPEKLFLLPNGVDTTIFNPINGDDKRFLRRELGLPQNKRIICFSGRADRRKQIDFVIKAFAEAIEEFDLYLLIIGPRDVKDKSFNLHLDHLIESAQMKEDILFTGLIDFTDARKYMQASDIFILPSRSEGLPNALIEAMACGLICLVADAAPMNRLIRHGENGWLIKDQHPSELKNLLHYLVKSKPSMGDNARSGIAAYDHRRIADETIHIYLRMNK